MHRFTGLQPYCFTLARRLGLARRSQLNTMTQTVQTNGVQPLSKTWELSLYELQRTPQEAITDGLEIAVSPRSLHSELMCPICLDMLKNTMTTKECLHRFCADCIITALRSGNKECPTCRKKLVSKRSLRPDPNFDALISKIYPSRDEYEAHQERVLARISKHNNQQALSHSIEEGLKIQAMTRLQRGKRHTVENGSGAEDNGDSSHCSNASVHSNQEAGPSIKRTKMSDDSGLDMDNTVENGGGDSVMDGGASEIELVFRPHPTLMEKDDGHSSVEFVPRYIKTSGNATVDHLSKYLAVRLALEELRRNADASPVNVEAASEKQYTIYIPTPGNQFTVLNGSFSLELSRGEAPTKVADQESRAADPPQKAASLTGSMWSGNVHSRSAGAPEALSARLSVLKTVERAARLERSSSEAAC
ncbi:hypothetical protein OJAV_G00166990 [Oryzias javanicus]|uniref:E3 ubiquitin-protein ligase RING2 n=1 Tax=Oryzias javanicus TaxID=123683 RepID=A0A437CDY5_ORYJA|nr:hypothetical protein OJAV_G00166990 [Oryzias javanicus]